MKPSFPPQSPWLRRNPNWLQRLLIGLVSVLLAVAAFTVASVLFVILLAIGLTVGGWLWWQYRKLIRQARQAQPAILEGEYTIDPNPPALEDPALPQPRQTPDNSSSLHRP